MNVPPQPPEITVGPTLTAYIEYNPDGPEAQLVELRLPFIPRIGEELRWGATSNFRYAVVLNINWVFTDEDENGIVRISHVNIHAEPLSSHEDSGEE